ncbi:MAG TPA: MurR/RpiR family transcriptional regulator [Pseudolabrys sp.]|nr:MurR/RpiR family transcriptional regulator [Pseudolabrys sp.]
MTRLSSFNSRLKSGFETLPPQLKEAARWVIDHPNDVALLSLREQARRAGIAPATLTRLAQRLGLGGYDGVRKLYADAMRQRPESYRGRAEELLVRRNSEGDSALVQDIFASLSQHLHNLSSPASVERFAAAADMIAGADHVFCLGLRSSYSVAYIFHYVRSLFGANSVLVDGSGGSGVDVLRTIGSGDVLLAISVKPYVKHTIDAAKFAKERGAQVVALTDSEISPLVALADEVILVRTDTPSFFHTMAPAFAVAECLAALIAARRGRETLKALEESERQLESFGTYAAPYAKRRHKS